MNESCQNMSNFPQQSLAKWKRLVRYLKRDRRWGYIFSYGRMVEKVTTFFRFRLGKLQRNSNIIKRRRDTARQPHPKSVHAQAKDHCKKQRRSRAVCCSIESARVERNCVAVEGSGLRDEASAGHRTLPPQTRNWQIEAR